LEFNQSEERKPISSLVNSALIDQNPIQSQSQSLVWYGLNIRLWVLSNYVHRWHCVTQCPLVRKRVYQCISFTLLDIVLHSVTCVRSWKAPCD